MSGPGTDQEHRPARADLHDALGWIALGLAVLVGSVTMDRLQNQNINPYTVPGLLPGLLGIGMLLLGGILALRSWRRGALTEAAPAQPADAHALRVRIAVVLALCLGYGVGLVGHGLPYWVASSIFVAVAILVLQRMSADPRDRRLTVRTWLQAVAIGLCAAIAVQLVFQELFLVRLP